MIFYGGSLLAISLLFKALWASVASDRSLLKAEVSEMEVNTIARATTPNLGVYLAVTALAFIAPRVAAFGCLVIAIVAVLRARGDARTPSTPEAGLTPRAGAAGGAADQRRCCTGLDADGDRARQALDRRPWAQDRRDRNHAREAAAGHQGRDRTFHLTSPEHRASERRRSRWREVRDWRVDASRARRARSPVSRRSRRVLRARFAKPRSRLELKTTGSAVSTAMATGPSG